MAAGGFVGQQLLGNKMKAIFVAALLVASALAQVVKKLIATTTFIDIVTTNIT